MPPGYNLYIAVVYIEHNVPESSGIFHRTCPGGFCVVFWSRLSSSNRPSKNIKEIPVHLLFQTAQNKSTDLGTIFASHVFVSVWTGAVGDNIDSFLI